MCTKVRSLAQLRFTELSSLTKTVKIMFKLLGFWKIQKGNLKKKLTGIGEAGKKSAAPVECSTWRVSESGANVKDRHKRNWKEWATLCISVIYICFSGKVIVLARKIEVSDGFGLEIENPQLVKLLQLRGYAKMGWIWFRIWIESFWQRRRCLS